MRNTIVKLILCSILLAFTANPQVYAAEYAEDPPTASIPMLASLLQISPNQLQVTYDKPVDQNKGMNPKNYWVQSTAAAAPTNIATLGMNDTVNNNNSLNSGKVSIQAADNNGRSFILTFNQNIAKGMALKMIICYITQPGAGPYSGGNGSATFIGR